MGNSYDDVMFLFPLKPVFTEICFPNGLIWDGRAVKLENRWIELNLIIFHTFNVRSLDIFLSAREIDFSGVQSFKSHTKSQFIQDALTLHLCNNMFWFILLRDHQAIHACHRLSLKKKNTAQWTAIINNWKTSKMNAKKVPEFF